MNALKIRRAAQDDLPAIILLDWMSFSLPWPVRAFARELTEPHSRVWVAETIAETPLTYASPVENGIAPFTAPVGQPAVVGMLVLWVVLDEAHIATLAVHPAMRQRGIARQLLVHALRQAAREGCESALLEVRASNLPAQKLYESFGFEVVGRRPRYYQDNNEDALLMTLPRIAVLEDTA